MKKLFFSLITLLLLIQVSFAQEKKERKKLTELPGAFVFDLGATRYVENPKTMDINIAGSRGINVGYSYDLKLIGENLSFSPGIGVSINNYSFKQPVTLGYANSSKGKDSLIMMNIADTFPGLKKSKLQANYIDIPLEFRFRTSSDINSFKVAIGARAGVLVSSLTKVKYKDGENKKLKSKESFDLERFRYGVHARIGYGIFHLFGYYSLSELFQKDKGPEGRAIVPYTVGITISTY